MYVCLPHRAPPVPRLWRFSADVSAVLPLNTTGRRCCLSQPTHRDCGVRAGARDPPQLHQLCDVSARARLLSPGKGRAHASPQHEPRLAWSMAAIRARRDVPLPVLRAVRQGALRHADQQSGVCPVLQAEGHRSAVPPSRASPGPSLRSVWCAQCMLTLTSFQFSCSVPRAPSLAAHRRPRGECAVRCMQLEVRPRPRLRRGAGSWPS